MFRILLLFTTLTLSACATMPHQLATGGSFADTTPQQAQSGDHEGERVRWGGIIIQTTPHPNQTCFEVMALPLNSNAEPEATDLSLGRFIACAEGFYEPALYAAGREITFTGSIDGIEKNKIGEYLYDFPRVAADTVYLWPRHREVIYVPHSDPYYWGPMWSPSPWHYYPWW